MKESLTKIFSKSLFYKFDEEACESRLDINKTVDNLLAAGVFVPPCRVGQTVYIIDEPDFDEPYVLPVKVSGVGQDNRGVWVTLDLPLGLKQSQYIEACSIGKTIFLSEDDAEEVLNERKNSLEKILFDAQSRSEQCDKGHGLETEIDLY